MYQDNKMTISFTEGKELTESLKKKNTHAVFGPLANYADRATACLLE
jgi:hypothetical protein